MAGDASDDTPGDPQDENKDLSSLISLPLETPEDAPPALEISLESDAAPAFESLEQLAPLPEPGSEATPAPGSMDSIKNYSENLAQTAPIAAAFPYTLKIEGTITPEDGEKLLSVLSSHNMGFREVDIEPQIAEGRILIPRISEYAGILLIQALRSVQAKISFGPSDEIFSTPDTRDEITGLDGTPAAWTSHDTLAENQVSQEIPVSNSDQIPQFSQVEIIDTVIASGLLTTKSVEAAFSDEYTLLLEALIRELKFKAKRRGANAIVSLQITLTPLTLPTDYRVTVSGSAVKGSRNPGV